MNSPLALECWQKAVCGKIFADCGRMQENVESDQERNLLITSAINLICDSRQTKRRVGDLNINEGSRQSQTFNSTLASFPISCWMLSRETFRKLADKTIMKVIKVFYVSCQFGRDKFLKAVK